jgi:hypothetical protein
VKRIRIAVGTLLAVGAAVVGVSLGAVAPSASSLGTHVTNGQSHVVLADSGWNQHALVNE